MFNTKEEKDENTLKVLSEFWQQRDEYHMRLNDASRSEQSIEFAQSILKGIEKTKSNISEEKKRLIELYYDQGETDFAEIADELNTTKSRARRLHKYILEEFGRNIGFL